MTCVLINQLATPGLGSMFGGRIVSGACQLLLALAGFCLLVAWMACFFYRQICQEMGDGQFEYPFGWMGKWGLILFAVAWAWALVTSVSLLRQAKKDAAAGSKGVPPRLCDRTSAPPRQKG